MNLNCTHFNLTLFCIRLCLITLIIVPSTYLYAKDLPLQVLSLSEQSSPVFKVSTQVEYSSDLAEKPPVLNTSKLHIRVVTTSSSIDLDDVVITLAKLSPSYDAIMFSIIPNNALSEKQYRNIYIDLNNALKEKGVLNVNLIAYPRDLKNLEFYTSESIMGIGVVIEKMDDIKNLDALYPSFLKINKPLFVQDRIKAFYRQDVSKAVKTLYAAYYTLAVKYPGIDTLLIPYEKNTTTTQYTRAYSAVLSKIQGSYTSADKSVKISGSNHFILWGDSNFFKDTAYVQYKCNDRHMAQSYHYPYPLTIDTTILHNGINRLKVIGFNSKNKVVWHKDIEVNVFNNITPKRSTRLKTVYAKDQKPSYKGSYIPVLMYHYFSETSPKHWQSNFVSTELFEEQLQALLKNNYTPITFYDLNQYMQGLGGLPSKPIIITADDGYLNNYTLAYPILKKYKVPATFFVSTVFVGEQTVHAHFSWENALIMEKSGLIDIQIHGHDHTRFTNLSIKDLRYQISISLGLIEKHLGKRDVIAVSCPEFKYNASTVALLSKMNVNFQITGLAKRGTILQSNGIKRINVPNTMSAEELLSTLKRITD